MLQFTHFLSCGNKQVTAVSPPPPDALATPTQTHPRSVAPTSRNTSGCTSVATPSHRPSASPSHTDSPESARRKGAKSEGTASQTSDSSSPSPPPLPLSQSLSNPKDMVRVLNANAESLLLVVESRLVRHQHTRLQTLRISAHARTHTLRHPPQTLPLPDPRGRR